MAINFFNIGDMMGLCNEYSQIKSSTYKKLVNTYYDKVQKGNDLDDISELFSKNNLKFYDIEIFVEALNSEGVKYSKMGYKHKLNTEFTWNR